MVTRQERGMETRYNLRLLFATTTRNRNYLQVRDSEKTTATRLPAITDARIEDYKAARIRGGTGPAGVNRDLSLLRLVLKQAKRERYIAQIPLDDPDHFLNERKERLQARPFTLEEEQQLPSVATGYLRPLLILLLDSGLRPNAEALPLRWKDIDFERGMITVIASKTPAGLRTAPMTTRLKAELLCWKRLTGPKNSEFVFFYPRKPNKALAPGSKNLGVP
jgi:integrase